MLDISNALRLPGLTDVSSSYAKSLVLPKGDRQVFTPKAVAVPPEFVMSSRHQAYQQKDERFDANVRHLFYGLPPKSRDTLQSCDRLSKQLPGLPPNGVLESMRPDEVPRNNMRVPQLHKLILDSGKLAKLDKLLAELKANGHRVLVYFQMTRMIDLMEEYLSFRQYKYLRLDGSSTISERRDMVSDWQTRPDLFIFLLSTRAGGVGACGLDLARVFHRWWCKTNRAREPNLSVGINLTSADTVIFYDCDWNPANDAQAMDRCHRIGQTKVRSKAQLFSHRDPLFLTRSYISSFAIAASHHLQTDHSRHHRRAHFTAGSKQAACSERRGWVEHHDGGHVRQASRSHVAAAGRRRNAGNRPETASEAADGGRAEERRRSKGPGLASRKQARPRVGAARDWHLHSNRRFGGRRRCACFLRQFFLVWL